MTRGSARHVLPESTATGTARPGRDPAQDTREAVAHGPVDPIAAGLGSAAVPPTGR
ncbi:hypothetical protein AB0465_30845 [Streptomyces griseoviridis]|uniref:hypothetical protein n=1 Tax=Streptomyces griseoviridis TaxID=45398 RepID=UPI00344DF17D